MYIKKLKSGKKVISARITKMFSGRYAFETKLLLHKSEKNEWELNMNMPIFDTKEQAENWIDKQYNWTENEQAAG